MRSTFVAVVLTLLVSPVHADAAVIGFSGLVPPSAFTTYTESGFTVAALSGEWVAFTFGKPEPAIVFFNTVVGPATGQVEITAGGSLFTVASVDLYSSVTPIPYVFTGLLHSSPVFTATGTVPSTLGNFATVSAGSGAVVDKLLITLSNPATPMVCCNPMGLDNIVVSSVPEPATLLLLGVGLGALARRRRKAAVTSSSPHAPAHRCPRHAIVISQSAAP